MALRIVSTELVHNYITYGLIALRINRTSTQLHTIWPREWLCVSKELVQNYITFGLVALSINRTSTKLHNAARCANFFPIFFQKPVPNEKEHNTNHKFDEREHSLSSLTTYNQHNKLHYSISTTVLSIIPCRSHHPPRQFLILV